MSGNRQVALNADAASAVRLDIQPFSSWRRSYSCRPDHDFGLDLLATDDNSVPINLVNAVSQADFYAKSFQPVLGSLREFRSKAAQYPRRHVDEYDPSFSEVDTPKLGFQPSTNKNRKR